MLGLVQCTESLRQAAGTLHLRNGSYGVAAGLPPEAPAEGLLLGWPTRGAHGLPHSVPQSHLHSRGSHAWAPNAGHRRKSPRPSL